MIELLVVIAIIGLLSSVVLASLGKARSKARDARRVSDIKQLQTTLELYYNSYKHYPISVGCGTATPANWCNSVETLSNGHWIKDAGVANVLAPYMAQEPTDPSQGARVWTPLNGGTYFYYSPAGGPWYMIIYGLENYPSPLENQDGVTSCSGYRYHYGSGVNGILTVGVSCPFH